MKRNNIGIACPKCNEYGFVGKISPDDLGNSLFCSNCLIAFKDQKRRTQPNNKKIAVIPASKLYQLCIDGKTTVKELAVKYNVSYSRAITYINDYAKENGLPKLTHTRGKSTKYDPVVLEKLVSQGYSPRKLAEKYKVSIKTMYVVLGKYRKKGYKV